MRRIHVAMDEEFVSRLDEEAALQNLSRSQYIVRACSQVLEKDKFLRTQPEIQVKMQELLDMFPRS